MKVTFLGTGTSQGIPVIGSDHPVCRSEDPRDRRLRVSVLIEWDNFSYVVDCGPDFRYQMLRAGCTKLNGIIFTHEHSDHVAGLDDIRPFVFRQGDMPLYAHKRVMNAIKRRFDYVFETENRYAGAPSVDPIEITDQPFQLNGLAVLPINVMHNTLDIFGFRFRDFTYITDAKYIEPAEIEKIRGTKVLVVNALRESRHVSHFSLEEAIDFIKLIQPERAYITHISHVMGFHAEVQERLPDNIYLAYDNLSITI
ncbi:MAG: MBL fold metallo-hydrolase [Bacteroidia bacterium]|nr:MBL fold metallo-hydrolase [Bacteroidia bacterium]NNK71485.1 MBL fold metallo-hydrolase [Flavobacteriaceae bacterium]NNL81659.1 MBL fold metallo-hydrolase [Flavobacteriaceae bacterium]